MAGYVISSNTLSFLQFDNKDDILKDTIASNTTKWNYSGTLLQDKKNRVSKPFGLEITSDTSMNVRGKDSYIKYDHYIDDSFTVDFWFKSIDACVELSLTSNTEFKLKAVGSNNLANRNGNLSSVIVSFDFSENGGKIYESTEIVYTNKWNHCAVTFNLTTGEIAFFYNGKKRLTKIVGSIKNYAKKYENNIPVSIKFSAPVKYENNSNYVPQYSWADCYFDNIRISKGILWDKDFFPPGVFGYQTFVHVDNAYGVKNGSTVLLSSNWSSLSNSDKEAKVQDLDYDVLPKVSDLIAKASDGNNSVVESYQGSAGTPNLVIKSAGKKVETVYQNTLLDLSKFISIDKIVPDYTITNSSTIRVAITTDLLTYKTYNFNTSSWETIDKDKVVSDGIPINKLDSIPKNSLSELGRKIAFAYTIILDNSETDTCQINSISIVTSSDEKWVKTKQEDQSYGYLNSKVLQITFSKSGDYKVNYNNSNDSI